METLGSDVLREARARAGLSQREVGVRAGLPQSVVSAYERGRREPTVSALRRLVAAAGFELEFQLAPRTFTPPAFTGPVGVKVQRRRDEARRLLTSRGFGSPSVFGSVARGSDDAESDVDMLVDLPPDVGLTQLARTAIDLETLFGVPVDLIPRDGVRAHLAADVAADGVPL